MKIYSREKKSTSSHQDDRIENRMEDFTSHPRRNPRRRDRYKKNENSKIKARGVEEEKNGKSPSCSSTSYLFYESKMARTVVGYQRGWGFQPLLSFPSEDHSILSLIQLLQLSPRDARLTHTRTRGTPIPDGTVCIGRKNRTRVFVRVPGIISHDFITRTQWCVHNTKPVCIPGDRFCFQDLIKKTSIFLSLHLSFCLLCFFFSFLFLV